MEIHALQKALAVAKQILGGGLQEITQIFVVYQPFRECDEIQHTHLKLAEVSGCLHPHVNSQASLSCQQCVQNAECKCQVLYKVVVVIYLVISASQRGKIIVLNKQTLG